MRTTTQTFLYKHPWELLVEAYLRRFPTHPRFPVLLRSTVLSDTTDAATGVRYVRRECVLDIEAPTYGLPTRVAGVSPALLTRLLRCLRWAVSPGG